MNTKPFDCFHESLICQYRELIHEAIYESEFNHKSDLDLNIWTHRFNSIMKAALLDGMSEKEVFDLVDEAQRDQTLELKVG